MLRQGLRKLTFRRRPELMTEGNNVKGSKYLRAKLEKYQL